MKLLNKGLKTHMKAQCAGEWCCLHNPSDHHMKEWPIYIRMDKYTLAERICPHGIGHPDPDSLAYLSRYPALQGAALEVHGCCGDCTIKGYVANLRRDTPCKMCGEGLQRHKSV